MGDHPDRAKPWIFRTYAGYGNPRVTNARYKTNLEKGQTGLSVAFDLPTQTGYDSDHLMARGEVGRVGVPICHLGDMRVLFEDIPLEQMNTSMTINATAMWLLALYVTVADEQGAPRASLAGTTQNDILKEFLSRGAHRFPPGPSMRLTTDLVTWTHREMPRWNPINVCSYHLQEAGADPVLGVTLGRDARARAIQLPAWNEALGLPRAWDQQWSLRAQQILAFETDLLEHGDILEGSTVVDGVTDRIATEAWEELHRVLEMGG